MNIRFILIALVSLIITPLSAYSRDKCIKEPSAISSDEEYFKYLEEGEASRIYVSQEKSGQMKTREFVSLDLVSKYMVPILAYQIKKSGKHYDAIVAIPRGGLCLAQMLSYPLHIHNILFASAQSYFEGDIQGEVQIGQLPNLENYNRVLLVDDLLDSGNTIKVLLQTLGALYPKVAIDTCVGHIKLSRDPMPTYYCFEGKDWIIYEWYGSHVE
ncbi:phosphoribosyl transferase domain protein [Chlamydia ibidis]|uniref:Phosphoribosyl transferase domain protein n=2 Tax=Chlamydia ibidis TaxID=1405396 RepID=S7J5K5_9CHLA|nr:phosphoribosyltransferase [Chlamydia ibidis]EPP35327.1 phosphoribosyl transferase domain protein [Chlamydia ibidis]EQM63028.1 phosphoribosyl transferase domain protein [Chlamydia ibidis 10-1398/6]